jgi:cob(I)alamin adenosyltransferase
MKIYTRRGDAGRTDLLGSKSVSKASPRVDAYGVVDELNSLIGAARASTADDANDPILLEIQHQLFRVGAELASSANASEEEIGVPLITGEQVAWLEETVDRFDADLPPLTRFILPGGAPGASLLQVARAVCRRAERALVALSEREPVRPDLLGYLNRLSDLLFVAARHANQRNGIAEVQWKGRKT